MEHANTVRVPFNQRLWTYWRYKDLETHYFPSSLGLGYNKKIKEILSNMWA